MKADLALTAICFVVVAFIFSAISFYYPGGSAFNLGILVATVGTVLVYESKIVPDRLFNERNILEEEFARRNYEYNKLPVNLADEENPN